MSTCTANRVKAVYFLMSCSKIQVFEKKISFFVSITTNNHRNGPSDI